MKKSRIALAVGALLLIGGCSSQQTIQAPAIDDLIHATTMRHDAMIQGTLDPKNMTPEDKAIYLRSSSALRAVVDTAMGREGVVVSTP